MTGFVCTIILQVGALRPEDSSCSSEHSEHDFAGSGFAGGSVMSATNQSSCLPHIQPLTKVLVAYHSTLCVWMHVLHTCIALVLT
jgi:hypothetical protein